MDYQENRASKSVKLALENALERLEMINGGDRLAVESEYREWIANRSIDDDVWFSTDKKIIEHQ